MDETTATTSRFMKVRDVAGEIDVTTRTVLRRIEDGSLPAVRVGRHWRIARSDFEAWIAAGGTQPRSLDGSLLTKPKTPAAG